MNVLTKLNLVIINFERQPNLLNRTKDKQKKFEGFARRKIKKINQQAKIDAEKDNRTQ